MRIFSQNRNSLKSFPFFLIEESFETPNRTALFSQMSQEYYSLFIDQSENKPEWAKRKISFWGATASLITQLKKGADLTKLSLPAVFLNPYSALELSSYRNAIQFPVLCGYKKNGLFGFFFQSDFGSKCCWDRINKEQDPLQRFLRVVAWFLAGIKQEDVSTKYFSLVFFWA